MKEADFEGSQPGMSLNDILFILFKHKWKIVICAAIGLLAAAAVFFLYKPLYASEAKLMVRYVVDRSNIDSVDSKRGAAATASLDDTIINSEIEILTSWDLAMEVAEAVSAENAAVPDAAKAQAPALAGQILSNLTVAPRKGSNVIAISYKDANPAQAFRILQELVKRYYDKHLQVHRSANSVELTDDVLTAKNLLMKTEEDLKNLRTDSGILSLTDSTTSLGAAIVRSEDEYHAAETELREQSARVEALQGVLVGTAPKETEKKSEARASIKDVQEYRTLNEQLTGLRQSELQLLTKYSAESRFVEVVRKQIAELESRRRYMEQKYPDLAASNPQSTGSGGPDLLSEATKLKALEARAESMRKRMEGYQEMGKKFSSIAPKLAELERAKELQEANYKYFESNLEKARVDEKLAKDSSKMPNISPVQKPSPPSMVMGKKNKIMLGLAGGGIALGLILAFFVEWIIDRTVKRPFELESRLGIPVLMSIPYLNGRKRPALTGPNGVKALNGHGEGLEIVKQTSELAPWEASHFIRKYCESIRDRLIVSFQIRNMHHKPKLVAVAGFSKGAGASTLAGGLAAALSETGEGKVLLVDMNVGESGEVHPFFEGRPAASLASILETNGSATKAAADNLYLATVNSPDTRNLPIGLRKFYSLMPIIKATDFDYVIFDMPALGPTSPTLGMAGFMDKVLLVVESEKNHAATLRRMHGDLIDSRADISYVFNKVRSYAPAWVEGEN